MTILELVIFQTEDGRRNRTVTGVQTYALAILLGKQQKIKVKKKNSQKQHQKKTKKIGRAPRREREKNSMLAVPSKKKFLTITSLSLYNNNIISNYFHTTISLLFT